MAVDRAEVESSPTQWPAEFRWASKYSIARSFARRSRLGSRVCSKKMRGRGEEGAGETVLRVNRSLRKSEIAQGNLVVRHGGKEASPDVIVAPFPTSAPKGPRQTSLGQSDQRERRPKVQTGRIGLSPEWAKLGWGPSDVPPFHGGSMECTLWSRPGAILSNPCRGRECLDLQQFAYLARVSTVSQKVDAHPRSLRPALPVDLRPDGEAVNHHLAGLQPRIHGGGHVDPQIVIDNRLVGAGHVGHVPQEAAAGE